MPIYNSDVSDILNLVADLLEIEGANEYRVRAYRNGARTIASLPGSVADMVEEGQDLTELAGIGEDLASKIQEIVQSGELQQLEEIQQRTPPELAAMLNISGLGPKRVGQLYRELGITSIEALKETAEAGRISDLPGLGPKTEQDVLEDLQKSSEEGRTRLDRAEEVAEPLIDYLRQIEGVDQVIVAGSYRRRKEMENPYFDILAHPTGRRIGKREPYQVDLERVMEAALEQGCFLEVNAHPDRLDLDDIHCQMAKEMGLKLAISSDAHRVSELDYMIFGVGQARRGWLEAEDVLNTRPWEELQRLLRRG